MPFLHSLRRRLADRISPEAPASRRDFFRQAAGVGVAAVGLNALIPDDEAWAAVEERATRFGITPGTLVDAQGRPVKSEGQFIEPFIGGIVMFGGNFAPRSWAFCNGQILAISSNSALFSLLGTTYGGDGRSTFALPDLRGRVPLHSGGNSAGPGLPPYREGNRGGINQVTLNTTQIPAHDHPQRGSSSVGTTENPANAVPGVPASSIPQYVPGAGSVAMGSTGLQGGTQPHENRQPYLAINFIIALQGIFPSRS
ncbi:MAG: tail fiber protein [Bacteroidota bacterium]